MQTAEVPGKSVDGLHDSVPAWSSTATMDSVGAPPADSLTVAVTEMVPPTSTLEEADFTTPMSTWITVVLAWALAVAVAPVWSVAVAVTVSVSVVGVADAR